MASPQQYFALLNNSKSCYVFGEEVSQFSITRPFIFEKWRVLAVTMTSLWFKAVEPIIASSIPIDWPVF